jgi:hypothetical protein
MPEIVFVRRIDLLAAALRALDYVVMPLACMDAELNAINGNRHF